MIPETHSDGRLYIASILRIVARLFVGVLFSVSSVSSVVQDFRVN